MAPARDICISVDTLAVRNWNFDDLQSHPSSAKNQVKVAERIEVAEKGTIVCQLEIVRTANHLGAAQSVLKALSKNEGKAIAKNLLPRRLKKRIASFSMG